MGNCLINTHSDKSSQNSSVEENMKKGHDAKIRKTLLLGAGESGKSTIFKQLKIIHQGGFSKEDRLMYRDVIYGNVLRAIKALVGATITFGVPIEKEENRLRAQEINCMDTDLIINIAKIWTQDLGNCIISLWEDEGVRKIYQRRNEFQLDECAGYYLDNMKRINEPNYIPSENDILRSRLKTSGVVEMDVKLNGVDVKLVDVGGQRNERKKWIHCFEGVSAIVFVSSLSEYDQKCYEDDSTNRMKESLILFDDICNSRWFFDTPIILLLNKIDLFRQKIIHTDPGVSFPEYNGGCNYDNALQFITQKYLDMNRQKDIKTIYTHVTCATDTEQVKTVFEIITRIILQKNHKDGGCV